MKNQFFLTPIVNTTIKKFLSSKEIFSLLEMFSSPLNILFPQNISGLIKQYKDIFYEFRLNGSIFYAAKAIKSNAVLKYLCTQPVSIDVASLAELQAALSAGISANRIEATGPKNAEFISLCLLHGVLINIDDIEELRKIITLYKKLTISIPINVLLRVNDFSSNTIQIIQKDVRFGINKKELPGVFDLLKNNKDSIYLKGFSFHLATTSIKERAIALEECIELILLANEQGLAPKIIDIGGGFSLNYLSSKKEWDTYETALKENLLTHKKSMSWNNSGLGYWVEKGTIRGSGKYTAFYNPVSQFEELKQVLYTQSTRHGLPLGQLLSELGLELYIEPGRSLLDQVGVTVARVSYAKKSLQNENLLVLEMNRSNLNAQDLEFMSDPMLIKSNPDLKREQYECFLVGNLCLPHDFITKRKVFFKEKPEPGDLLAFINTAGYFMDFDESATLRQHIAHKVAVIREEDIFTSYLDDYFPIGKEITNLT